MRELPELMLSYGITLKQRGNRFECLCPAHDDHHPSMSVYRDSDGKWKSHCFACGFHEDAIGFIRYIETCSFERAMEILDDPTYKKNGKRFATIEDEKLKKIPKRETYPPPIDAPEPNWGSIMLSDGRYLGDPVKVWTYRTPNGSVWFYEARYEVKDDNGNVKKEPRCWSWGHRGSMPPKWECGAPMPLRPLYGLDKLAGAKQIMIVEGPKTAEAVQNIIGNAIACITWPLGANGVKRANWSLLSKHTDYQVILCPDADDVGIKAMRLIAWELSSIGFKSIEMVDTEGMPEGWDLADGINDGWTRDELVKWVRERKKYYEPKPEPEQENTKSDNEKKNIKQYIDSSGYNWCHDPVNVWEGSTLPTVTQNMLPATIWNYINDRARIMGVDPSMMALAAVISVAGVIHDGIQIQPNPKNREWTESARLWGAIVGDPSSKKTPVISQVTAIHRRIGQRLAKEEATIREEFKIKKEEYEAKRKEYIKAKAKREPAYKPDPIELPEIPRLLIENSTLEKAQEIASTTSRGLFLLRDELSEWIGSHDAYKSRGGSDRGAWLSSFGGGPLYVDRIGRGSISIANWSVSILGGIQNDVIARMAKNMTDDGLMQRFLVVCCNKPAENGVDEMPDIAAGKAWENMIENLWATLPSVDKVQMSDEAVEERRFIVDKARELININYMSPSLVAHLGKWEGICSRLILVFHCIECSVAEVHPSSVKVSGKTASMVRKYMLNHLLSHAVSFYTNVITSGKQSQILQMICGRILAQGTGELRVRDIDRGGPYAWRDLDDEQKRQILVRLVEWGWAMIPDPTDYFRRRPSRLLINPNVHLRFAEFKEREINRINRNREIALSIADGGYGVREDDY